MELITLIVVILVFIGVVFVFLKPPPQIPDSTSVIENFRQEVTAALKSQEDRVVSQTGLVSNRLDSAAKVIGEVQNKLGELGQATKEIKELGQSVQGLQQLLQAPKMRGAFGETMMEDMLRQVLPAGLLEFQHRFKSGEVVDGYITLGQKHVPIDSKFPLSNYKLSLQATSEIESKAAARALLSDFRKHVDAISSKYILPDEGTFDFAILFCPSEAVYYELLIRSEGSMDPEGKMLTYALSKRVFPVSPNSLYVYLITIAYGLRGMEIEKSAQDILAGLSRIALDIERFRESFDTLGNHIKNGAAKYDEADKRLGGVETKVGQLTEGQSGGRVVAI